MSEYIKREDAVQLQDVCTDTKADKEYFLERLNAIPSADVVEVVRCKDCKWWSKLPPDKQFIEGRIYGTCYKWSAMARNDIGTQSHYYCSYGERKDNE